jgi:hypothetical protein
MVKVNYPQLATLEGYGDMGGFFEDQPELLGFSFKKLYRRAKKATRKVKRIGKKAYRGGLKVYRPIRNVTRLAKKYTPKEYKKYWNLKTYAQKDPRLKAIYKGYQQARDARRVYNRAGGLKAFKKLKNIAALVPGGKNYYRAYKGIRDTGRKTGTTNMFKKMFRRKSTRSRSREPKRTTSYRPMRRSYSPSQSRYRSRRSGFGPSLMSKLQENKNKKVVEKTKKSDNLLPLAIGIGAGLMALA